MKIQFKKKEDVDCNKMFPIISPDDYALIENHSLEITAKDWKTAQKNGFYEIGNLQVSTDLIITGDDIGMTDIHLMAQEEIGKKYIYSEPVVDGIMTAFETRKNLLLWGKGGHAKSDITMEVMRILQEKELLKSKPFVQVFGDGMTEDKLFGGMNIMKYKEEGKLEYLPENSFMNHQVVIFEEIFDAPAPVLLALKDVLTAKELRNGTETYKLKTKVIIALTNRSKEEFSDNDESLKALTERFPLTVKVEWPSYKRADFRNLFKKVHGNEFYNKNKLKLDTLASICDMNNMEGNRFVSPRTAVSASEIYTRGKNLKLISDLDPVIIDQYFETERIEAQTIQQNEFITRIETYIDRHGLEEADSSQNYLEQLNKLENEFKGVSDAEVSDLDFGSNNDALVKKNKASFLINLLKLQNPIPSKASDFAKLNTRLRDIATLLDVTETDDGNATSKTDDGVDLPF